MANTLLDKKKVTGKTHDHIYQPRGACKEIFETKEEEVLISGPAGTGKSRACLEKIFAVCLATPNVRALILRKTLSSLGSTALVTWRNYVVKEAMITGTVVYYGGSSQEAPQYRFRNGSTVTIGGLDRPTRIMSSEYDIVYVQEATEITLEDLELIKTRLRNWKISFQQLIMDCNPAQREHWLKLRCDDGLCTMIESRHEDNPVLFKQVIHPNGTVEYTVTEKGSKYISLLDKLTGVRYQRLRLGLWVSAEGIIYEEFDPTVHILQWEYDEAGNRLPLPDDWPRYWVIDFGYVHPFVCKWYAEGPDGELYMYRQIFMTGRTVSEHCQTILDCVTETHTVEWEDHLNKVTRTKDVIEWIEPEPQAIICDHDAEGRRTLEKELGIGTTPAIKNVYEGISLTKDRLKVDASGLARLYYMEDTLVELDQSLRDRLLPTESKEEFGAYIWATTPAGKKQDKPVKDNDDGMDTDRYMVTFLDWKGKMRYSELS